MSGFEAMSTDHAEELSKSKKVSDIQKRRAISTEAKRADAEDPLNQPASKKETAAVLKQIKKKQKLDQEKQDVDAKETRRARALSVYQRYFSSRNPELQRACGGVPPNAGWTCEQAEAHVDRVRNSMNAESAKTWCRSSVGWAAEGVEFMTMRVGLNPREWDLNGFGEVMREAVNDEEHQPLEPELSEMSAELGDFLSVPWSARLCMKMYGLMETYSANRKRLLHEQRRAPTQQAQQQAPQVQEETEPISVSKEKRKQ